MFLTNWVSLLFEAGTLACMDVIKGNDKKRKEISSHKDTSVLKQSKIVKKFPGLILMLKYWERTLASTLSERGWNKMARYIAKRDTVLLLFISHTSNRVNLMTQNYGALEAVKRFGWYQRRSLLYETVQRALTLIEHSAADTLYKLKKLEMSQRHILFYVNTRLKI